MALAVIATKGIPRKQNKKDFQVPIHIEIKNESNEIIFEKDYSERWYSALNIDVIKARFQAKIKEDWDIYKEEQAKYNAVLFDTMVAELESTAATYINQ